MMTRPLSLAALAVAGALALAACGGSSTSSSSGAGSAPAYGGGAAAGAPSGPTGASVVSTRTSSLGTFLVDGQGRTLYLWDADHGPKSTCNAACAQAWPPLTTTAAPKATGAVKSSLLGTAPRADGSREVTYAGHPLYTYTGDTGPGQTAGEGSDAFGAPWWTVTTAGRALQDQPM